MNIRDSDDGKNIQDCPTLTFPLRKRDMSGTASSFLVNLNEEDQDDGKDRVQRALMLMRKVEVPKIRNEFNYSQDSIFGDVAKVPLKSLKDIKKSAYVSLQEKRIREHKLTPFQMELLSKFDRGPRKIATDVVDKIVREEEADIQKKRLALRRKKLAWTSNQPAESRQASVEADDMASICTSVTFSTANLSQNEEDIFEIDNFPDKNESQHNEGEIKNKSKTITRTRSQVVRNKNKQLKEEEDRKRAKILNKKTRGTSKRQSNEITTKQQIWLHLISHFSRLNYLQKVLRNYRTQVALLRLHSLQKRAIARIWEWYQHHKFRHKMMQNAFMISRIRIAVAVHVRKSRVRKRVEAAAILSHFISAVNGSSSRTQKLYKFRSRVIKIQRAFGQYYKCQRARLKLLFMAFERELHLARLERNREKNYRERVCVRTMKRAAFFGEAVQKLDDVCSNLSAMIARRNKANNLKIRQLRQLQNENPKPQEKPQAMKRKMSCHILGKSSFDASKRHYEPILKKVLGNQRRRHILSHSGDDNSPFKTRLQAHQAVDPDDVKEFLKVPNHPGPKFVVLDHRVANNLESNPLLLLTGGGLQELKYLARNKVAEEDDEEMNYELQRVLEGDTDDSFML